MNISLESLKKYSCNKKKHFAYNKKNKWLIIILKKILTSSLLNGKMHTARFLRIISECYKYLWPFTPNKES